MKLVWRVAKKILKKLLFRVFVVVSATEVYAHIGEESLKAVSEIEETLISYLKGKPPTLAEPPMLDTYVVLCKTDIPCR